VDPRLLTAISTGGKVAELSSDSEHESESEDEAPAPAPVPLTKAEVAVAPVPLTKAEERRLLIEKLAAEYAEEEAKGCAACSS
jgi:hypothetical protein